MLHITKHIYDKKDSTERHWQNNLPAQHCAVVVRACLT